MELRNKLSDDTIHQFPFPTTHSAYESCTKINGTPENRVVGLSTVLIIL